MKKARQVLLMLSGLALGAGWGASRCVREQPVLFRSLESLTEDGGAVFNEVRFLRGAQQDVWLMRQSHRGLGPAKETWDRLAIVVDKVFEPRRARFYQLEPGALTWDRSKLRTAPRRARCFACHANGPRAIRPADAGLLDRVRIAFLNLRIKTYGKVESVAGHEDPSGAAFRAKLPLFRQPLKLRSCVSCHSEKGIRNELRFEHAGTAAFLVRNRLMPPFPFRVSEEDRSILESLGAPRVPAGK